MAVVVSFVGKVNFSDIAKAQKELQAYSNQANLSGKATSSLSKSLGNMAQIAGGLGLARAAHEVFSFAKESIEAFGNLGRQVRELQRLTGGTAESLSALAYAASQTGVPAEKLSLALVKMEKATSGTGKAFDALGISTKDANGNVKEALPLFTEVQSKISSMGDGTAKTAAVMGIFGRGAKDLIPLLNKNGTEMKELARQAAALGLVLSEKDLEAVKENVMAHRQFDAALKGVQVTIGRQLEPALTGMMQTLTNVLPTVMNLVQSFMSIPAPVLGVAAALLLLQTRLGTALVGLVQGAIASFTRFSETLVFNIALSREAAAAQIATGGASGAMAAGMAAARGVAVTLGVAIKGVLVSLGPVGIALAVASAAAAIFMGRSSAGNEETKTWTKSLYDQNGALVANAKLLTVAGLANNTVLQGASKFGISLSDIFAATNGNVIAAGRIDALLSKASVLSNGQAFTLSDPKGQAANKIIAEIVDVREQMKLAANQAALLRQAMATLGLKGAEGAAGVTTTGAAAAKTKAEFVSLTSVMSKFFASVANTAKTGGVLAASLGGDLIAAFSLKVQKAGKISKQTATDFESMASTIKSNVVAALDMANKALDKALGLFNDYSASVAGGVMGGNQLADAASAQSDAITALADAQRAYNEAVAGGDPEAITKAKNELGAARNQQRSFLNFLQGGADTATAFAGQLDALRLGGASLEVVQQIAQLGAQTGGRIIAELLSGTNAAIQRANTLVETISSVARRAGNAAAQQFYGAGVASAQAFVEAIEKTIPLLQGTLERIAKMIGAALGITVNAGDLNSLDKSATRTPSVYDTGNAAYDAFNRNLDFLLGDVPAMATGGMVNGATLALIGESGPEAVVPLNRMSQMGGNSYTINVNAGVGDPRAIGQQIVEYIGKFERSNSPVFARA